MTNPYPTYCTHSDYCSAFYEKDKNCIDRNGKYCNLATFLDVEENRNLIIRVKKRHSPNKSISPLIGGITGQQTGSDTFQMQCGEYRRFEDLL